MENELDRITNQKLLERLLLTYQTLYEPQLAQDLPEYGCALQYVFAGWCIEQQMTALHALNAACARLFVRNLVALVHECPGLLDSMRQRMERAAHCVEFIVQHEAAMDDATPMPVAAIVTAVVLLIRARYRTEELTPVMSRFLQFYRLTVPPTNKRMRVA